MKDTFRYFIRKNFPEFDLINTYEDIDEIGNLFHKYLEGKLKELQKEATLPKKALDLPIKPDYKINEFEPIYSLQFYKWLKVQLAEKL